MSKYDDFGQNFPRNSFGALTTVAAVVVAFFSIWGWQMAKFRHKKRKALSWPFLEK